MFTPLGLDHVVLRVRDQAASQKFYTDGAGVHARRTSTSGSRSCSSASATS